MVVLYSVASWMGTGVMLTTMLEDVVIGWCRCHRSICGRLSIVGVEVDVNAVVTAL